MKKKNHIFRNECCFFFYYYFLMMLEILLSCLAIFFFSLQLQAWSCDADPAPVYGTADGWCNTGYWLQNRKEEENQIASLRCTHIFKMLIVCSLKYYKGLCIYNWDASSCIIEVLMYTFGEGGKSVQKLYISNCV